MKRYARLLLLFIAIVTLHSCEEEVSYPYHLVQSVTESGNGSQFYIYDCKNRIVRGDFEGVGYQIAEYADGQVTITSYSIPTETLQSYIVALTSEGNLTVLGGGNCIYNDDGRLISRQYEQDSTTTIYNYEYSDGNLMQEGYYGVQPYVTYTYHKDKFETRMIGFQTLTGKPSFNLLSTRTEHFGSNSQSTITYSYTFDSKGRVVTETATHDDGGFNRKRSYTYFD